MKISEISTIRIESHVWGSQLTIAFVLSLLFGRLTTYGSENPVDGRALSGIMEKYRRPVSPPISPHNLPTVARRTLGKALFFDPRLSKSKSISCASCHNPSLSWADGLPKAIGFGFQESKRRTPTLLNVGWGELYFWDGRAESLEAQALGPIQAPNEMNLSLSVLEARIKASAGYRQLFQEAYPGEEIDSTTIAKSIAVFERSIVSGPAPFDKWIEGEATAISESAKRGFDLFNGKANCAACHVGWNFTDDGFHDIGAITDDAGRGKHIPQVEAVQYAFKTPTLRNVERRAPYLHNGSEGTLLDVLELYSKGGRIKRSSLAQEIRPLTLSLQEKEDLIAFLSTLTARDLPVELPEIPN